MCSIKWYYGDSAEMPFDATVLNHAFPIGVFRFTLVPRGTLFVPAINKANMLRGAFGHAFRRLCCVPQCSHAYACPLASSCPYKAIFEPSPPPDADRLSRNQDVPRPFVFRAPADPKTRFEPGEEFEFGLVLIGRALDHLPYFVLAFRELAAQGLGLNRAKCELKQVTEGTGDGEQGTWSRERYFNRGSQDRTRTHNDILSSRQQEIEAPEKSLENRKVFDCTDQVFHSPQGLNLNQWVDLRTRELSTKDEGSTDHPITGSPGQQIRIRFLSPTWIKSENQIVRQPSFAHIFKRLRDRINALSTFFGTGPLDADFAGLGQRSEQVRTVSCNVRWEERFRTSSKTHQRHELSGFTGEAVYEGRLEEFLPWLILGELVHVGKHTAWGMGEIEVTGYR